MKNNFRLDTYTKSLNFSCVICLCLRACEEYVSSNRLGGINVKHSFVVLKLPLTYTCMEISVTSVVWTYYTSENNSDVKDKFTKYLKESCWVGSEQYFL